MVSDFYGFNQSPEPLMAPDESIEATLARLRERHVESERVTAHSPRPLPHCPRCIVPWPCDTARLLSHIEGLQAAPAFPNHLSMTLSHNEHKNYYRTVADEIDEHGMLANADWVSDEQRAKAIETDECWAIQWYPITPIGFNLLAAADLDALQEALAQLPHHRNPK